MALSSAKGITHALRVPLPHQSGEQGVHPELVVVVQILVSQAQSVHPLGNEVEHRVLDQVRITVIDEAGGEVLEDAGAQIHLTQKQASRIGSDVTAIEVSGDFPANDLGERKGRSATLCLHGAVDLRGYKLLREQPLIAEAAASLYLVMRDPG